MNTVFAVWFASVPVKTAADERRADVERRVDRVEQVEHLAEQLQRRRAA